MSTTTEQPQQKQVSLADINVDNENTALNVMVAMLNMAQRRGAFTLEESSKCWDCVDVYEEGGNFLRQLDQQIQHLVE